MRATLLMACALLSGALAAQGLSRTVVASGGASHTAPALQLSWTVGEAAVTFHTAPAIQLCEGFQQGEDAAPTACEEVTLEFGTGTTPADLSWEIEDILSTAIVASGSGLLFPAGSTVQEVHCLPTSRCYKLRVTDSGDGANGYQLRLTATQERIIDNSDNLGTGLSEISATESFCLPLGSDQLIVSQCDKMDFLAGDLMIASENAAVAAQFGVTNATSGFQFWLFDPNGTYTRRVFISHNSYNGMTADVDRSRHLNFSWLQTSPVPADLMLNMRIRGRVDGNYLPFGPACRLMVLSAPPACPTTELVDHIGNPNFSCGVVRTFGFSDKVYANPVAGANRYQFRFINTGESFLRHIAFNNAGCVLNWVTLPLEDGVPYDVQVRVSFDGGANYCDWGDVCVVTIQNPPTVQARSISAPTATLWPNPNRGDQLWLTIQELPDAVTTIAMDIHDLRGQLVMDKVITTQGGMFQEAVNLNGDLTMGMYLVTITAGNLRFTERLVITQ